MEKHNIPKLRFSLEDQQRAYDEFGANCGPGAVAGVCGYTPGEVLNVMPEFERRRSTTEIMLTAALDGLGVIWEERTPDLVSYGILRVQWHGPWLDDADPYEKMRHSHWVGISKLSDRPQVFDINAISVGGWIDKDEWAHGLVPWLLETSEPRATGEWHMSEGYEVKRLLHTELVSNI